MKVENIKKFSQNISPYLLKIYKPLIDQLLNKYESAVNRDQFSLNAFFMSEVKIRADIINYLQNKLRDIPKK